MGVEAEGWSLRRFTGRAGKRIRRRGAQEIRPHRRSGQQRRRHDPAGADDRAGCKKVGLHHRRQSARAVFDHPSRSADHDATKSGSIINVSSMIGRGAYANFLAYATSKWGLEGFTQTLAAEARSSNIRVNSVEPGYVATKLTGFQRQQTGVGDRRLRLSCFRRIQRRHRQNAQLIGLEV